MSKYKSPLENELWISQTYHSNSSNKAVDFGSTPVGTSVYSMSNGVVNTVSSNQGSYLTVNVENSDHTLFYVHVYNFKVSKGQSVKVGDKLAEIAPQSVTEFVPHLHIGLQPQYNLMDYMDRSLVFKTKYSDIKADWFNSDGSLNWSLFQDLNYDNTSSIKFNVGDRIIFKEKVKIRVGSGKEYDTQQITTPNVTIATIKGGPRTADGYSWYDCVIDGGGSGWCAYSDGWFEIYTEPIPEPTPTPEPPQDPVVCLQCEEYQKQITELQNKIYTLESTTEAQKKELDGLKPSIEILNGEIEERNKEITGLEDDLNSAVEQRDRFEKQYMEAVQQLNASKKNTFLEIIIQFFTDLLQKLKNRTKL